MRPQDYLNYRQPNVTIGNLLAADSEIEELRRAWMRQHDLTDSSAYAYDDFIQALRNPTLESCTYLHACCQPFYGMRPSWKRLVGFDNWQNNLLCYYDAMLSVVPLDVLGVWLQFEKGQGRWRRDDTENIPRLWYYPDLSDYAVYTTGFGKFRFRMKLGASQLHLGLMEYIDRTYLSIGGPLGRVVIDKADDVMVQWSYSFGLERVRRVPLPPLPAEARGYVGAIVMQHLPPYNYPRIITERFLGVTHGEHHQSTMYRTERRQHSVIPD